MTIGYELKWYGSENLFFFVHSDSQVIGHAALANILWHHAKHIDLKSKTEISGFYMFIWKVRNSIHLFSIYPLWFR